MVGRTLDWNDELGRWLKPFVDLCVPKTSSLLIV